jgi:hypothetical protein
MAESHRTTPRASRKTVAQAVKAPKSEFTAERLQAMSDALKSGRMKVDKLMISDDIVTGLRALVRSTGTVSFHCQYDFNGSRPMLKVGDLGETTVEEARELTKTIRALAAKGIDVQSGLHERLLRELRAQGTRWRP